ncbi:MAG: hypothetical protein H7327_02125 [Herminiimonas sp.]|nr:hypothetical protein [Herminiimonas sp.]
MAVHVWVIKEGTVAIPILGPIKAGNGDIICLAALSGAGIIFQPQFMVDGEIAVSRLVRVLP